MAEPVREPVMEPIPAPTPKPSLPATILPSVTPSPVVTRFMATFSRNLTPAHRADVSRQMTAALLAGGVDFKGSIVRAVDVEHLDDMCLEVMEEPPRDPNAAWVSVLTKLRETYTEVTSARNKALERATARVRLPEGMEGDAPAGATPIRAALAGVLTDLGVSRGTSEDDA
jgi:hypothetical protein